MPAVVIKLLFFNRRERSDSGEGRGVRKGETERREEGRKGGKGGRGKGGVDERW